MSNSVFNNRVFGCAIVKAINSNYNADFTHQPRTLPDGTAYATDKAFKYSVRNYIKSQFSDEKIFYFKTLSDDLQPRNLDETYESYFGKFPAEKDAALRKAVLKNLLTCIDVRLFGATYAGKTNISIHGTTQLTHGVNRFGESIIYSEQIMSPFRTGNDKSADSQMTSLGTQSKLTEGHYVHHFSINPANIKDSVSKVEGTPLGSDDIAILKEAMRRGATYYDSSSKAGTENELLLWVQLKEGSKAVLPSFVELVDVNDKRVIDLQKIKDLLGSDSIKNEIESIEIYYDATTKVANAPDNATLHPLN